MAAGLKLDDGTGAFVNNCFPVRSIIKYGEPGEGAWLEAHRAEQRKRFKAVVCSKPPRTYSRLRQERIIAEREGEDVAETDRGTTLDGFFLMKHCCVQDPTDVCSINIAGVGITNARPDDFSLFDNVAYINAADNALSLDVFNRFSILRELELPVNGVSSLKLSHKMLPNLEMLDLSYNKLSPEDVLEIGYLRNLKVLYLSGNNLSSLPENMAGFYITKGGFKKRRFPKLEILCLDDNDLNNYTAFAPLAGLKDLKHLNLETNEISAVPQLESKTIKHEAAQDKQSGEVNAQPADSTNKPEKTLEELAEEPVADFDFGALNLPDMAALDVTKLMGTETTGVGADGEAVTDSEDDMEEDAVAVPFPQLRFLTLAHNYLTEEEDLLPIAAWPNLTQVHIFDNPLTNDRSGDPPMLKRFLTDRLGIDLIRKQPAVMRPVKEFPVPRKDRKISTIVPPVPKCDVDKLLSIESMKELPSSAGEKTVLPPINKEHIVTESPEKCKDEARHTDKQGEAFFMTQVEEMAAHPRNEPEKSTVLVPPPAEPKHIQIAAEQQHVFAGYEELLIEDEFEKDIHVPLDVHNSVKALSYALKHPVVNNYTMRLESAQKPFHSYQRSDVTSRKRPQTKAEKISRAMDGVRAMSTVIESPLDRALTDKQLVKKYPEAAKLLQEIQRKYANVHSSSVGHSEAVRTALHQKDARRHTDLVYMVDKQSSSTDLRASTNL